MRTPRTSVVLGALSAAVLAADGLLSPGGSSWRALVCCALLAALGTAGARLIDRLLPGECLPPRITGAFVLSVALGLTAATALGLLGRLTPRAFELIVAVATVLCLLLAGKQAPLPSSSTESSAARHPEGELGGRSVLASFLLLLPAGLLLCAMVSSLLELRNSPPGAFSYDDTSYHLSTVAHWLHSHDLSTLKFAFGDPSTTFYPLGGELWSWILLAPLRDSDVLARWSQLPFALCTLAAVAALARRLGLSWQATLLAVVTYGSVPRAFPQLALSAGNDHQLAFFMVAGADAALRVAARPDRRRTAYAGVVLGLLLGTKYLAVLHAPLLACLWIAARRDVVSGTASFFPPSPGRREGMGEGGQGGEGPRPLVLAGIVLAFAFLAGGFTYVRTAAVTGNPLFPAPVRAFGWQVFPGWTGASLAARHGEEGGDVVTLLWRRSDLLGALFRWTLLPGAFAAAAAALWSWRRPPWGRAGAVLALLPFGLAAVFAGLHDHRDVRYVFAALAFAGVSLARAVDRLPSRLRDGLAFVLSLAWALTVLAVQTGPRQAVVVSAVALVLTGAAAWLLARGAEPRPFPGARGLLAVLALAAAAGLPAWIRSYESHRFDGWPDAVMLAMITGQTPAVVAYVGGNQPYLLAGSRLQNRIEIVPTHGPAVARLFDWRGTTDFPFLGGRFAAWWRNLQELGVELVVVQRSEALQLEGADELRWMESHPDRFQAIFQASTYEIWRVTRGPS